MFKIMEARELIEEATPDDRDEIERLVENTHRQSLTVYLILQAHLVAGDIEDTINELSLEIERQEWKKTKAAAIRLRYLEGIERAAKQWMDNHYINS